jgi:hypothetical protein
MALQEPVGWDTERVVRRYVHLAAELLAPQVGNAQIHGAFLAHTPSYGNCLTSRARSSQDNDAGSLRSASAGWHEKASASLVAEVRHR